jgi:arylsulfatase
MSKLAALAIAAAVLAAFWLGRSCAPTHEIESDRIIDLLGLLRDAEIVTIPGGDHATLMDRRRETTFDEDEVFVPAPAPTRYTFRNLSVPPSARLVHRAGRDRSSAPDDREVTFSATVLEPGKSPQLLFARRAAQADFSDAQTFIEETVDLGPWAGKTIDLELACEPVLAAETPILWCGFYSPRVESEGRAMRREDVVTLTRRQGFEFLAHLSEAKVTGSGAKPQVAEVTASAKAGGTRRAIAMWPDQRLEWPALRTTETSELALGFGIAQSDLPKVKGEVRLRILLDDRVVFEQSLRPGDEPRDQGYKDVRVSLRAPAGDHRIAFDCTRQPAGPPICVGLSSPRLIEFDRTRARTAGDPGRNVIVILIDTLRADHLSCQGYPRATTPRLDAFAQGALRYDRAISAASWTSPATASIFTARPVYAHGLVDQGSHWLADELKTMAEAFAEGGYTTGAFVANPLVSWESNFDQGFHVYDLAPWANARGMLALARDWIASVKERRFFAYIHLIDPHSKYSAPGISHDRFKDDPWHETVPRDEKLEPRGRVILDDARRSYDAEVAFADEQIGVFLDGLRKLGLFDDAIIAVTSDHGEEFNEHGRLEHGHSLYEELIHVPLIIGGPGVQSGVLRASVPTLRLGPTLARLAGLPPVREWTEASLPIAPDEPVDLGECYANTEMPKFNGLEIAPAQIKDAIRGERYKLIISTLEKDGTQQLELYDLEQDPGEQHDQSTTQPQRTAAMLSQFEAWKKSAREQAPNAQSAIDPSSVLEKIGYVAPGKKSKERK